MIGSGVPGVPARADPVAGLVLDALDLQIGGLSAAAARLTSCRGAMPDSADGTWEGPAHIAYGTGLLHLRHLLLAAGSAVDEALAETRAARAAMELEQ